MILAQRLQWVLFKTEKSVLYRIFILNVPLCENKLQIMKMTAMKEFLELFN